MDQVSRPMQIALVAVVLFAGLWFVALRPKPASGVGGTPVQPASSASPTAPGVKGLTSDIAKAHGAAAASAAHDAATAQQAARSAGDPSVATPAAPAATTTPATATPAPTTSAPAGATPSHEKATRPAHRTRAHAVPATGPKRAAAALAHHKVLAVLFYNPDAADDRSVARQFRHESTHRGKVVLVRAPLARLASYASVTKKASVTGSPTVVVIDRAGRTRTFVGFIDPVELAANIDNALAGFKH